MSTEQELEVLPNKAHSYEEFVASARNFSSENPRFMKVSNPVLLRFDIRRWRLLQSLDTEVRAFGDYVQ